MAITSAQKQKILRVLNVFETGTPDGKYDNISIYRDGPVVNGQRIYQITYGRSQTTEYGNLKRLLELYAQRGGALAADLAPYLPRVGRQPSLRDDAEFRRLLKVSAQQDAIMRQTQDEFFDIYYYQPALNWFDGQGFREALSLLVIYDSFIHSGQMRADIRQKFAKRTPSNGGNERIWIDEYVKARHNWLANHSNTDLHATVYRTNCFKTQIRNGNWNLGQPVNANGTVVS